MNDFAGSLATRARTTALLPRSSVRNGGTVGEFGESFVARILTEFNSPFE
jgi:hypothetical protein